MVIQAFKRGVAQMGDRKKEVHSIIEKVSGGYDVTLWIDDKRKAREAENEGVSP